MSTKNLLFAKIKKEDEHYTLYECIEKEGIRNESCARIADYT